MGCSFTDEPDGTRLQVNVGTDAREEANDVALQKSAGAKMNDSAADEVADRCIALFVYTSRN